MSNEEKVSSKRLKTNEENTATPSPSTAIVQWGIIGCGKISRKWARAIQHSGHVVIALASRSSKQAEAFAQNNNISGAKIYGDYLDLIKDEQVQAVVITIPTTLRMEWVAQSLEHKKHVLMEKPHLSAQKVGEVFQLACERGMQLMDGVMFMHAARLEHMQKRIQDNVLGGPPTRVVSMFADGVLPTDNIRLDPCLEPMGSLADLGTYNVRITLWAFNWELPDRVRAVATSKTNNALTGVVAWMLYGDGRVGTFDANNASAVSQWAHISSSSAVMKIPDFVVPSEQGSHYAIERTEWGNFDCKTTVERVEIGPHIQESVAISSFSRAITDNLPTQGFWGVQALKTQLVLDALMESIIQGGNEVQVDKGLVEKVLRGSGHMY